MMNSIDFDKEFNEIIRLKNIGQAEHALQLAIELSKKIRKGSVFGLIASLYFEMDNYEEAAKYYRKATEITPTSEMASLGLFHCLLEIGKRNEALKEMERFRLVSSSKEYDELRKEFLK